jgi:hypothetical protein
MYRAGALAREAVVSAFAAASVAALLAWYGPPGSDFAAHAYQRAVFLQHGFSLWNNFWYAGRYSYITYSLLYYPLAGWFGIRLLAVATIATAALAFAVVLGREWGPTARWSSRTFAVVWAGIVLSAAFPFALGIALALLALWALQARLLWRFALLCALTLAASPLAFLLLVLLLGGVALGRRVAPSRLVRPGIAVASIGAIEVVLWRLFPGGGRYPFSFAELAAAITFCLIGAGVTWRVERARILRAIFLVYLAACIVAYLVPSAVGENIARLRFAAIPVAVLALSLRDWRPRIVAVISLGLAIAWNVTPLAASYAKGSADPAATPAYWAPAVAYLERNLTPSYRVEVVDTTGHWGAVYLPKAGIPLARGWFRQDDFPENQLLYSTLGPRAYTRWLRSLGVRYVVLTRAPVDYSARGEEAVVQGGRAPLRPVFSTPQLTVFELEGARPIVTGPAPASVVKLTQAHVVLRLARAGTYRIAIRYSPYWKPSVGCAKPGRDGMIRLVAPRAGTVKLGFDVDAERALTTLAGQTPVCRP